MRLYNIIFDLVKAIFIAIFLSYTHIVSGSILLLVTICANGWRWMAIAPHQSFDDRSSRSDNLISVLEAFAWRRYSIPTNGLILILFYDYVTQWLTFELGSAYPDLGRNFLLTSVRRKAMGATVFQFLFKFQLTDYTWLIISSLKNVKKKITEHFLGTIVLSPQQAAQINDLKFN